MEFFCPECMGALVKTDNQMARCSLDGKEHRILFARFEFEEAVPVAVSTPGTLTEHTKCYQHLNSEAFYLCRDCQVPLCVTCAFAQDDGTQLCPECVMGKKQATVKTLPIGLMCVQHPTVSAAQRCKICGTGMCATCDFLLPGGVHVCPVCMSAPRDTLSPKRKKMMVWSYVLAVWSTLGMGVLFSGALANSKEGEAIAGLVGTAIFIPSIVGTAVGFGALDRRLHNPLALWIAAIWNGLFLAIYLVLIFIGLGK